MQNQDPLNPMDNAQITSQMAQINTVSGIEKLNTTVEGLNAQFVQMQALQGAALVGRDVTLEGNGLWIENGVGVGAFDLTGAADNVKVEVLDASGRVAETLQLGAAGAGRHSLRLEGRHRGRRQPLHLPRHRAVGHGHRAQRHALMRDRVDAVSTDGGEHDAGDGALGQRRLRRRQGLQLIPHRGHHPMSFQQGLSGLNATSKNLDVIGNNIANANTYGAKIARVEFGDMYATALNGAGTNSIGIGVNVAAVAQQFTQGNISTTGNAMDLAINGAGFFQVTDGLSPTQYSRNGQFKVDREGFIVNNQGLQLLGYPADANGVIQPGLAQPLQLPTAGIAPAATTEISHRAEPRLARQGDEPRRRRRAADRLHRPHHLQQRDLDHRVRREGPGRGDDLLLPEDRQRPVEHLRHRERPARERRAGRARPHHHGTDRLSRRRQRPDQRGLGAADLAERHDWSPPPAPPS